MGGKIKQLEKGVIAHAKKEDKLQLTLVGEREKVKASKVEYYRVSREREIKIDELTEL